MKKKIKSFKVFEKYRDAEWFENLLDGLKKLIQSPLYYNKEKIDTKSTTLTNRDRIVKKLKEIFNKDIDMGMESEMSIDFSIPIKYSKSKALRFRIIELDDEYFWIKVYLFQYRSTNKNIPGYVFVCDQENSIYSLMMDIKKLLYNT